MFEHCLWYFVRDGGAPKITVVDHDEAILLDDVYRRVHDSLRPAQSLTIKGKPFELTHLKLKASTPREPFVAWCAAGRVVKEEGITGKVSGLHGRIVDDDGDFVYACYMTSPFLDQHVRPERIGFDIEEISDDLFAATELSLTDIRTAVLESSKEVSCHVFAREVVLPGVSALRNSCRSAHLGTAHSCEDQRREVERGSVNLR